MGTKNNPGSFDCYAEAKDDEPIFILLARDEAAPDVVQAWITARLRSGKNQPNDEQILEATQCAAAMQAWRLKSGGRIR